MAYERMWAAQRELENPEGPPYKDHEFESQRGNVTRSFSILTYSDEIFGSDTERAKKAFREFAVRLRALYNRIPPRLKGREPVEIDGYITTYSGSSAPRKLKEKILQDAKNLFRTEVFTALQGTRLTGPREGAPLVPGDVAGQIAKFAYGGRRTRKSKSKSMRRKRTVSRKRR